MKRSNKKIVLRIIKLILSIMVLYGLYYILDYYWIGPIRTGGGYRIYGTTEKNTIWGAILFFGVLSAFILGFFYKLSIKNKINRIKWNMVLRFSKYAFFIIIAMGIFCCLETENYNPPLIMLLAFVSGYICDKDKFNN